VTWPLRCSIVLLVLTAAPACAATPYLTLQPGLATMADAARVLGAPVLKLADVLHEHKPQEGTGPIYVEYRLGSDIVERIEVKLTGPVNRADLIAAMGLPLQNVAASMSDGALTEYFADDMAVALTYGGADPGSGVRSILYDSDRLFEREVARAKGAAREGATSTPARTAPPATTGETGVSASPAPMPGGAPAGPGGPAAPGQVAPTPAPAGPAAAPVARDPRACLDLFLWADAQESASRRGDQVVRRQKAMEIRLAAQSGDCSRARQLADDYRKQYGVP
jgi:hypothetical protein